MEELKFERDFFTKLNRLRYELKMPQIRGRSGNRRSAVKGASVEFSDYREYQAGDDTRRIDWNAYGRFEKLYTKEYMEEKEAIVQIFLDTSNSMNFGAFNAKKSKLALELTAALSYLIISHLDRVRIRQVADGNQLEGKLHSGRSRFGTLLKELQQVTFQGTTNLEASAKKASFSPRGLSIVISDFLDPNGVEGLIRYLAYQKQEILFIQILAREEIKMEDAGLLELEEMETGQKLIVTITAKEAKLYQKRAETYLKDLKMLCNRYGVMFCQAFSEEPFEQVLLKQLSYLSFIQNGR